MLRRKKRRDDRKEDTITEDGTTQQRDVGIVQNLSEERGSGQLWEAV